MMGKATYGADQEPNDDLIAVRPCQSGPLAVGHSRDTLREALPASLDVSWSLIDPDLQDLSVDCRKYIRYFDMEMSKECVVYQTSSNPFLSLMPLMSRSHALSHAMIAISAFHYSHRLVINQMQISSAERRLLEVDNTSLWHKSQGRDWQLSQQNFSPSLRVALAHKQRALQYLKVEIQDDDVTNNDAAVAAIVLFICMDVVEFGSRGWEHHLGGAGEILQQRKATLQNRSLGTDHWLEYFDTAYTTFGIMGATLAPTKGSFAQQLASLDPSLLRILRQSEDQTWVGCPAELLYLVSVINSMRSLSTCSEAEQLKVDELCKGLENFSPSAWAENFPDPEHYQSRSHLAHAYKAAVEVYASHIVGPLLDQGHNLSDLYLEGVTRSAILHMLSISAQDFHVKSLVWPTFVVGAEIQAADLKIMVREIFRNIWITSCCYNVRNAIEVLERIWARDDEEKKAKSWLNYLWSLEESWLFL
ncbi:hypothetical protein CSIM01_04215 [Colletotrichum simmondsii]|uniref:Acriflavine sensitivity control protein acr-2 n=1 Tax=Colletotrichum simmondsii TaxID=703756 RepID=A0A135RNH0_9PEZI|nr:hypothetical protein CSIM01_04215 [Colletotrichum simmondsii]